ncbi:hypothetical protein E2562_009803 [Oryza meyeriana var. granulata]|uniref:Uncharacterized protein n=1 Tax=Oryza meyeriana var. granulata TaxID=110450 RepID=A0A6G1BUE4_9ORYZ|nr:hypothetical protein E2562_009803 [Oryza meyeriana var. granulata]
MSSSPLSPWRRRLQDPLPRRWETWKAAAEGFRGQWHGGQAPWRQRTLAPHGMESTDSARPTLATSPPRPVGVAIQRRSHLSPPLSLLP